MTKRVNFLPSERIDLPDMVDGTTGVAVGMSQQLLTDFVIAKFPRVATGFRVEVANGNEITVWNGVAVDRAGEVVENTDEANTQRSVTLSADNTYYLEVAYTENLTDTDARAFWDTTFDNGTDPSGDARMPGRELFQAVATRLTPDWNIVSPVSTSGFAISSNPNSTNIPLAVITVSGGVVTGATTVVAHTCLAATALSGSTTLRVIDSRLFPSTFTATVDSEAISVTANDQVNGVLTLSAATALTHLPGARITRTGSGLNQFLPALASDGSLPTSGTADARPGLFRGNEDRGSALAQDPDSGNRSDSQIASIKDQIDFLAAQLRDIRFGAERANDIGQLAPPSSFPTTPHYFDRSGGFVGARTVTVSVGDGATSWGDFNVTTLSTPEAALTAAIAALPASGGVILVRAGTYNFATGLSLTSKQFTLVGENGRTILQATAAAPVLTLANCNLGLRDIAIERTSGSTCTSAIASSNSTGSTMTLSARNCVIHGISGPSYLHGYYENCSFQEVAGGGSNGYCIASRIVGATFVGCTFTSGTNAAGTRTVYMEGLGGSNVQFYGCHFVAAGAAQVAVFEATSSNVGGSLVLDGCSFTGSATSTATDGILLSGHPNVVVRNCVASGTGIGGLVQVNGSTNVVIEKCGLTSATASQYGVLVTSGTQVSVVDCAFSGSAITAQLCYGVQVTSGTGINVARCSFTNLAYGVYLTAATSVNVSDCTATGNTSSIGRAFVYVSGAVTGLTVARCYVTALGDPADGILCGVRFNTTITGLLVDGLIVTDIGTSGTTVSVCGVYGADSGTYNGDVKIVNCRFANLITGSSHYCYGVYVPNASTFTGVVIANTYLSEIAFSNGIGGYGFYLGGSQNVQIANCVGNLIGNTAISATGQFINIAGLTNGSITGNVATNLGSGFGTLGIGIGATCIEVSINNNQFEITGAGLSAGISIGQSTGTTAVSGVTITGNKIGGANATATGLGIEVLTSNNSSTANGRITVSGNTIRGVTGTGILIEGSTVADGMDNVVVNGNTVQCTDNAATVGIDCVACVNPVISGNSILMNDNNATAKQAISGDSCIGVMCANNTIYVGCSTATGIVSFTNCVRGVLSGNCIYVAEFGAAGTFVFAMPTPNPQFYVTGNQVRVGNAANGALLTGFWVQNSLNAGAANYNDTTYTPTYPSSANLSSLASTISANWWGI